MSRALLVEGLSKQYTVGSAVAPPGTLYETLSSVFTRRPARSAAAETFWALRDVGFEIRAGEVVGVIGRNGAGKSTLLKVLSRITAPTEGRVVARGRMASLLEVGTGFHPELTGRENIFLNGAILGMRRADILRHFDAIVDFAEVGRFVDTPVKRYSSGMYVRLAFSIAAHLEPDILLIDEVLAVGDAAFQRKSLGKMGDVARAGRTVLFVSHNLSAVRNLCTSAMVLDGGRLVFNGTTSQALAHYENQFVQAAGRVEASQFSGPLGSQVRFEQVAALQDGERVPLLDPLRPFVVEVHGVAGRDFAALELNITVSRDGVHITSCFDSEVPLPIAAGPFVSRYHFSGGTMRPGRYSIGLGAATPPDWVWGPDAAILEFSDNLGQRQPHQVGIVGLPFQAERIQNLASDS